MLDMDTALRDELSREVELQVDRICMLLMDARLAEWASDPDNFDGNVETARNGLYRPITPATPVDAFYPAEHLAYWFEARARYWKERPPPSGQRVSSAGLLDQAKAMEGRLQAAVAAGQPAEEARRAQTEQRLKTLQTVLAVAPQQARGRRT